MKRGGDKAMERKTEELENEKQEWSNKINNMVIRNKSEKCVVLL
jgi:hypothetical protein